MVPIQALLTDFKKHLLAMPLEGVDAPPNIKSDEPEGTEDAPKLNPPEGVLEFIAPNWNDGVMPLPGLKSKPEVPPGVPLDPAENIFEVPPAIR